MNTKTTISLLIVVFASIIPLVFMGSKFKKDTTNWEADEAHSRIRLDWYQKYSVQLKEASNQTLLKKCNEVSIIIKTSDCMQAFDHYMNGRFAGKEMQQPPWWPSKEIGEISLEIRAGKAEPQPDIYEQVIRREIAPSTLDGIYRPPTQLGSVQPEWVDYLKGGLAMSVTTAIAIAALIVLAHKAKAASTSKAFRIFSATSMCWVVVVITYFMLTPEGILYDVLQVTKFALLPPVALAICLLIFRQAMKQPR